MALDSLPNSAMNNTNGHLMRVNDPKRGWIIQKFGGTSVGKFADKIAEDVVRWELSLYISLSLSLSRSFR